MTVSALTIFFKCPIGAIRPVKFTTYMLKRFFQTLKMKMMARQLRKPSGKTGIKTGTMMNRVNEFLYDLTFHTMQVKDNDAILEIGFGNGKFFTALFSKAANLSLTGLDFSATMLREASENNRALLSAGKLVLTQGSSHKMPFTDNSFDKIFCINVIYFWDEPAAHLQEIKRVLKPGGRFFATIRTKESMAMMPFTKYGFATYTEESWNKLLLQNGLEPADCIQINDPEIDFNGKSFRGRSCCLVAEKKSL
jgi:SAM-dependent methyltransferase